MRPIVFVHSDQWHLLIVSVTAGLPGPQLPAHIHTFYYAPWLQAPAVANGVDAHHMRYHMLLGRTSTMPCMWDMQLYDMEIGRFIQGEAINSGDCTEPVISLRELF